MLLDRDIPFYLSCVAWLVLAKCKAPEAGTRWSLLSSLAASLVTLTLLAAQSQQSFYFKLRNHEISKQDSETVPILSLFQGQLFRMNRLSCCLPFLTCDSPAKF